MPTLNDSLPIDKNSVKYNPYQEIEDKNFVIILQTTLVNLKKTKPKENIWY